MFFQFCIFSFSILSEEKCALKSSFYCVLFLFSYFTSTNLSMENPLWFLMRYDWSWISYFSSYDLFYALLCIWPRCTVLVMFIFYISVCLSVHHTIHWGIIEPFKAHSSNFRHCVSNWTVSLTFTISLMHYSSCLPKNSSILKQFKIFPRNTVSYVLDKTNWWEQFKCEMGLVADLNYPSDPKVTSIISLTWQPNVILVIL